MSADPCPCGCGKSRRYSVGLTKAEVVFLIRLLSWLPGVRRLRSARGVLWKIGRALADA